MVETNDIMVESMTSSSPTPLPPRAVTLLAALLLLALPTPSPAQDAQNALQDAPYIQITFLNVGQADAVVIRAPEGQTALIDAGRSNPLQLLNDLNIDQIDLLVATHPHADHIGGMTDVLNAIPVRFYMDNGQPHTTATYRRLLSTLQERTDITYLTAEPRTISLGSAELEVLPLPPIDAVDHNNRSVGLVLRFGSFTAFLSGDSEVQELTHFLREGVVPDVTLLKAPHHGSNNGFTPEFLQTSRPEVVVISVGSNNYGHPRPEALYAYNAIAEQVYRTDFHGHVTVLGYEDGSYEVIVGQDTVASGRERADADGSGRRPEPLPPTPGTPTDQRPIPSGALWVFPDAPGNDHQNPNGEYAVLESWTTQTIDLGGWTLCDAVRHCFRFPTGAVLPDGGQVVVYTGYGTNDGDTATLYDAGGTPVLRYVY